MPWKLSHLPSPNAGRQIILAEGDRTAPSLAAPTVIQPPIAEGNAGDVFRRARRSGYKLSTGGRLPNVTGGAPAGAAHFTALAMTCNTSF